MRIQKDQDRRIAVVPDRHRVSSPASFRLMLITYMLPAVPDRGAAGFMHMNTLCHSDIGAENGLIRSGFSFSFR